MTAFRYTPAEPMSYVSGTQIDSLAPMVQEAGDPPIYPASQYMGLGLPTWSSDQTQAAEDQWAMWWRTLQGMRQTLQIAQQANNQGMMDQVRDAFHFVIGQMNGVSAAINRQERPSPTMMMVAKVGDTATKIAVALGESVDTVANALPKTADTLAVVLRYLPWIAVGLGGLLVISVVGPMLRGAQR